MTQMLYDAHIKVQRSLLLVVAFSILAFGTMSAAKNYQLQGVKRLDQDLYKSASGLYIETQYCYHYTYGEDAILKWEGKY